MLSASGGGSTTTEHFLKELFEGAAGERPRRRDSIPGADEEMLWPRRMAQGTDGNQRKVPFIGLVAQNRGRTIPLCLWRNEHEARLLGEIPEDGGRPTGYRGRVIRASDVISNSVVSLLVEVRASLNPGDPDESAIMAPLPKLFEGMAKIREHGFTWTHELCACARPAADPDREPQRSFFMKYGKRETPPEQRAGLSFLTGSWCGLRDMSEEHAEF